MNKFANFAQFFFCIFLICSLFYSASASSDLVEDSWNTKTSMRQSRAELGVVAVEGNLYAIGGRTATAFVGTNERYNPVTDTWVTRNAMPTPRAGFAIVAYENKIYCIGGYSDNYYDTNPKSVFSINEVYDTITDSWSTKTSSPVPGEKLQAHVVGKQIFVIDTSCGNLFLYDPIKDSWIQKTSIPHPDANVDSTIFWGFSVAVNNKIITYFEYMYDHWTYRNKVMIYDIKTDMWSEGNVPSCIPDDVSNPYAPFAGITGLTGVTGGFYAPPKVYVFSANNDILVYNPADDTWSTTKGILTNRNFFGIATVDDILYVIGGCTGDYFARVCSINEQYVPIGYDSDGVHGLYDSAETFLKYIVVVILTLLSGVVVGAVLFLYAKKTKHERKKLKK